MSLIGKYNEHDLGSTAYQKQKHSEVGDQIIFLGGSGSFTFQVDEGVTNQVRAGISFKMPEGQTFNSITFNETAGATGNILFAIASGSVVDARSVISGETPVLNSASPNDELQIKTKVGTELDVNITNQIPYVDLSGHTFSFFDTGGIGDTELVSSAANTNGVLISHVMMQTYNPTQTVILKIADVNFMVLSNAFNAENYIQLQTPVMVGAGDSIKYSKAANTRLIIAHKVL